MIKQNTQISYSSKDTFLFGSNLGERLENGDVVLLSGDLGSGKTTFSKGIAKALGVKNEIISPSFVIVKEYKGKSTTFFHLDMYRIKSEDELENIGVDELFDGNSIVVIEWNIKKNIPSKRLYKVFIEVKMDLSRQITIEN